jgi:hypothetical protein
MVRSRHTPAALREAKDAGRAAADEANFKNEWETIN